MASGCKSRTLPNTRSRCTNTPKLTWFNTFSRSQKLQQQLAQVIHSHRLCFPFGPTDEVRRHYLPIRGLPMRCRTDSRDSPSHRCREYGFAFLGRFQGRRFPPPPSGTRPNLDKSHAPAASLRRPAKQEAWEGGLSGAHGSSSLPGLETGSARFASNPERRQALWGRLQNRPLVTVLIQRSEVQLEDSPQSLGRLWPL